MAATKTTEAKAVVKMMHELPVEDAIMRHPTLRPDGRLIHDTYLFRVKKPRESKSRDDIYALVATTPADQAFKTLAQSACPLLGKTTQ